MEKNSSAGRLAGKTIIVTGAASGLGKATALLCASEGGCVVCADLDEGGIAATALQAVAEGGKALACRLDVADLPAAEAAARFALEKFGRIDAVMNFAGIAGNGTAMDTEPEVWNKVIGINLTGLWHMCRAVLPAMVKQGGGSVVNVASVGGLVGIPGNAPYCAAKAGVIGLTRSIAVDFAPHNIRANAICPGTVPTPLVIGHYLKRGELQAGDIEEGMRATRKRYPLQRHGKPEEIAALAVYLASDDSGFMTGAALPIDGGLSSAGWQVGQ